jgi:hypothetical protein
MGDKERSVPSESKIELDHGVEHLGEAVHFLGQLFPAATINVHKHPFPTATTTKFNN